MRAAASIRSVVLNRFWDDIDAPRDESWAEDIVTARNAGRAEGGIWRDIRAGAESGWDFSSRWLADGRRLETIRTTRIVPCCLKALLFGLESALGPLQWIACEAFENYGERTTAVDIAARWIALVTQEFQATGRMFEKYDVEVGGSGARGEYETQEGFGWTNGVTAALLARYREGALQG